jgi:hypothetical protein
MPRAAKNPVSKVEIAPTTSTTSNNKSSRRTGGEDAITRSESIIVAQPRQNDVLDHGLDDYRWHHVWINSGDQAQFFSYYQEGYRFVPYDEVKERIEGDELRSFLYKETVDNRLAYDTLRLMRIPTQLFVERQTQGWKQVGGGDVASVARKELENYIETQREDPKTHFADAGVKLSVDEDHGDKQTTTVGGEE